MQLHFCLQSKFLWFDCNIYIQCRSEFKSQQEEPQPDIIPINLPRMVSKDVLIKIIMLSFVITHYSLLISYIGTIP